MYNALCFRLIQGFRALPYVSPILYFLVFAFFVFYFLSCCLNKNQNVFACCLYFMLSSELCRCSSNTVPCPADYVQYRIGNRVYYWAWLTHTRSFSAKSEDTHTRTCFLKNLKAFNQPFRASAPSRENCFETYIGRYHKNSTTYRSSLKIILNAFLR